MVKHHQARPDLIFRAIGDRTGRALLERIVRLPRHLDDDPSDQE